MKSKIFILITITLLLASCANRGAKNKEKDMAKITTESTDSTEKSPMFEIITTQGSIIIQLYDDTPLHRDNFTKLVNEKFFDGILFHRVINGFMIQAGDPSTKDSTANRNNFGSDDSGYTIPAEIVAAHKHKKGALAAARQGDTVNPDRESSGSQFYLVQSEEGCSHLNGAYTVFGETIEGLDVIDRIAAVPTNQRDLPLVDIRIIKIVPLK